MKQWYALYVSLYFYGRWDFLFCWWTFIQCFIVRHMEILGFPVRTQGSYGSQNLAITWWRHQISALLAICAGNSPVSGKFPAQRPVTWSFGVFFDLCLIKRLRKHSRGWWFETLSRPLRRHCSEIPPPAIVYWYHRATKLLWLQWPILLTWIKL